MDWWLWIILGLCLLASELLTPGLFVLLFFGISAIIVGFLVSIDLGGDLTFQLLVFAIIAVALAVFLRGKLLKVVDQPVTSDRDSLIGKDGNAEEDIAPGERGKVSCRGTTWTAKNIGNDHIINGSRIIVDSVEGILLHCHSDKNKE